ncbi:phage tail protein [Clostridium tetani]|uniref:tail family protein n=1 Tax=Clostridium phage phiCT19406C TaxID=1567011 RepID=UPI000513E0E4|nr:distal tail protein Dit [Clostridium tetani]YP_009218078.1 tail family protein [Clostridium phage phiCT19406C]AJA42872.1 tail protein [Clostridium phage phiCT19406C]KGI44670.1 hypothetical protein KY54_07280 [Clostridium tetani]KHO30865.1 hypothetical protein OR63_13455 [Clostridium tetani]RXI57503.1 phage tail protein [Clostridium tetani]RXI62345.1 phage tail protein [Clostridium tetani]
MFSIQFNNYNSYKDLGLIAEHRPNIPIPEKNIRHIYIQGSNGTLIEDLGTYKDIEIPITFGFKEKEKFLDKCRFIKHWLNNIKNRKLILNDDADMFYKVKYVRTNNIERSMRTLGKLTVTFISEPFKYLEDEIIEMNDNMNIYNPGTFKSQPYIKMFATGDITLNINNEIVKFNGIEDYIELDSEIQECYKDTLNCNNKMTGEFPTLKTGKNNISWTGNVNKIEITPRWRCL